MFKKILRNKLSFFLLLFLISITIIWHNQTKFIKIDTVINGDYIINKYQKLILQNSAKLTVLGNLQIKGKIECENGPLYIEIKKNLLVEGEITCQRNDEIIKKNNSDTAIILIINESANFTTTSKITANSHIQIINNIKQLLANSKQTNNTFDDVIRPEAKDKFVLGPFLENNELNNYFITTNIEPQFIQEKKSNSQININGKWIIGSPKYLNSEKYNLSKIPKKNEKIILYLNLPSSKIFIGTSEIFLQDGNKEEDSRKSCDIIIKKEAKTDAPRMLIRANSILINNLSLYLGDGGKGSDIESETQCMYINIVAGPGGLPGDFKMIAQNDFTIVGKFNLYPGSTGAGGVAIVQNLSDCKSSNKIIYAEGGKALNNYQQLRFSPSISGVENISIGNVQAGNGGYAVIYQKNQDGVKAVGGLGGKSFIQIPDFTERTRSYDNDLDGLDGNGEIKALNCQ